MSTVDYTVRGIPAEDKFQIETHAKVSGRTLAAETRLALAVWAALGDEAREKLLAELRRIQFAPARPAPKRTRSK